MEKVFVYLSIFMFIGLLGGLGYICFLMCQYIEKTEYAIRLYEMCKYVIPQNITLVYPMKKEYRGKNTEIKIVFYSSYEASEKVLLAVEDALKYYDKLGCIALYSIGEMKEYKVKLDMIFKEVAEMQMQLQSEGS